MREIKFRAYEKDSGEMFIPCTDNNNEIFFAGLKDGHVKVATSLYSEEDEYVLMQYTGLKDKNGREIYEGDIVEFDDCFGSDYGGWNDCRNKGVVKYDEETMSFYFTGRESVEMHEIDFDELIVLGNNHENPELLEAGE